VSEIHKRWGNLVDAATHAGELRTWQSLLQEMERVVHNNPHWYRVGLEHDTATQWICAVWIKLQHSHDIHQVNAVVALQYVKEDYEQGYALSVDERELSPKEKAELSHDALQETCVGGNPCFSQLSPPWPLTPFCCLKTDGPALPSCPPSH
jgi:hypothetical protein